MSGQDYKYRASRAKHRRKSKLDIEKQLAASSNPNPVSDQSKPYEHLGIEAMCREEGTVVMQDGEVVDYCCLSGVNRADIKTLNRADLTHEIVDGITGLTKDMDPGLAYQVQAKEADGFQIRATP